VSVACISAPGIRGCARVGARWRHKALQANFRECRKPTPGAGDRRVGGVENSPAGLIYALAYLFSVPTLSIRLGQAFHAKTPGPRWAPGAWGCFGCGRA